MFLSKSGVVGIFAVTGVVVVVPAAFGPAAFGLAAAAVLPDSHQCVVPTPVSKIL